MNDKKLESKIRKDTAKVKKELDALVKDTTVRMNKFEDQATQTAGRAKVELAARVEDSLSQLSKNFEKLMDDVPGVKKEIGHRFGEISAKVQKLINKKSNDASRRTTIYRVVAVSLALMAGVGMFFLFKPVQSASD